MANTTIHRVCNYQPYILLVKNSYNKKKIGGATKDTVGATKFYNKGSLGQLNFRKLL